MILEDRSVEKRRMGVCGFGGLEIMESEIEEVGGGGKGTLYKTLKELIVLERTFYVHGNSIATHVGSGLCN